MKKPEGITTHEAAEKLGASRTFLLKLIHSGAIKAKKERGRYYIAPAHFAKIHKNNGRKVEALRKEYVGLYWQGLTVKQLQARTESDLIENCIVADPAGFAERAIYEDQMQRRKEGGK